MAKLTLHVSEELVSAAKSTAAARKVSVSKLVSDYFTSIAADKSVSETSVEQLAPRTQRLAGSLPQADADIENYIDHLERKHS